MFEKIGRLAEAAASNVSLSRRGFLGRLGQAALGTSLVLGGLLVFPQVASAKQRGMCCWSGSTFLGCAPTCRGCPAGTTRCTACTSCRGYAG